MINATLYNFSKRINSTKQPTGGEVVNVALKEQCSVYTPVLLLNSNLSVVNEFNYVKFLGNYYYITDIISISNNHVEIHCQIDVMATFKDEIMATTAYVLYSTSGTTEITDTRLLVNNNIYTSETRVEVPAFTYRSKGAFILNVVSESGNELTGFTTTYMLSPSEIGRIANQLLEPTVAEEFDKFFTKPFDAIISCTWTPIAITNPDLSTQEVPVVIGKYNTGVIGHLVESSTISGSIDLTIPHLTNNYLDIEPYTRATLYLPFVGVVGIDSSFLYGKDTLTVDYTIDLFTGDIVYMIKCNENIISTQSGRCGSVIPVANSGIDVMRYVSGLGMVVGGLATGGLFGMAAVGAGLLTNGIASGQTQTQVNGGYSGRAGIIDMYIKLEYAQRDTSDIPTAITNVLGLPYGKIVSLGSLRGYVQCSNASVQANTNTEYLSQINDYLNGGAYIE